ncbi:MAG: sugar-binding domain-containing protein [SAR324 cluster bacterium]|nr:sugar-binding domain-containing protein [SAR324 cluster bacterium]MDP7500960.1 sugar-binding domain-containing protein [SAR324 cluster bacterium]
MPREPQKDSKAFISEICWHYYINGLTQADVARNMGVTRLRVNQAIQKAKASGMVQIEVGSPFIIRLEIQQRLEQKLGIKKALVVPGDRKQYDNLAPVGAALAHFLTNALKTEDWGKIGVTWGSTLRKTLETLKYQKYPELEFLSFNGGLATGSSFNSFSIASGFAEVLNANYSHFVAPIILPKNVDRDEFLNQDFYKEHIEKCFEADAVLLAAGDISDRSIIVKYGLPKEINVQSLLDADTVGDVLGRFMDIDGNEVDHPVNSRVAGVGLDELKNIPNKILTASGEHKIDIIIAAIRRGLVDTLITDDITAELLLKEA